MLLSRKGNSLYLPTGEKLLICEREKITARKSKLFLLRITKQGKRSYISSLYGSPPEFELEYNGVRYSLTLTDIDTATLKAKSGKGVFSG
jgi:hypothetical protein